MFARLPKETSVHLRWESNAWFIALCGNGEDLSLSSQGVLSSGDNRNQSQRQGSYTCSQVRSGGLLRGVSSEPLGRRTNRGLRGEGRLWCVACQDLFECLQLCYLHHQDDRKGESQAGPPHLPGRQKALQLHCPACKVYLKLNLFLRNEDNHHNRWLWCLNLYETKL